MLTCADVCSQVISSLADFEPGAKFQAVIDERETSAIKPPAEVQRVLLCSGKVYYELVQARQKKKLNNIAIVTLEQVRMLTYADVC